MVSYDMYMALSATKFRREMFAALESVRAGKTLEIAYKGTLIHLTPVKSSSKLAGLRKQPVFAQGARTWKADVRREVKQAVAEDWNEV